MVPSSPLMGILSCLIKSQTSYAATVAPAIPIKSQQSDAKLVDEPFLADFLALETAPRMELDALGTSTPKVPMGIATIAHTERASVATIIDGLSCLTLSSGPSAMVPGTIFIFPNEMLSRLADMLKPVDSLIHHNFSESCRRMLQFLVDDALTKHKVLSKLGISDNTPPPDTSSHKQEIRAIFKKKAEILAVTCNNTLVVECFCILKDAAYLGEIRHKVREACLDVINSTIIEAKIDRNCTDLNLNCPGITRIPKKLFERVDLADYWKKLQWLYCSCTSLIALTLQGLPALQNLDCSNNQLTSLTLRGLPALRRLYCCNNPLTSLTLRELPVLQILDCQNNHLLSLNLEELTSLRQLYCSHNQLTSLNLQQLTALQKLDCSYNQLTLLNLQGLTALQERHCFNNRLTSPNLQELQRLEGWCQSPQPFGQSLQPFGQDPGPLY